MDKLFLASVKSDQILAISILVISIIFVIISVGFLFVLINSVFNSVKEMQDRAVNTVNIVNETLKDVEQTETLITNFDLRNGQTGKVLVNLCGLSCAAHQASFGTIPYATACESFFPDTPCP